MLKFKIINSPHHVSRDMRLKLGAEKLVFSKKDLDQTFIIGEKGEEGAKGGAYLLKKLRDDIQEDLFDLLDTVSQEMVWECSCIYLGSFLPELTPQEYGVEAFLEGLYETFIAFGVQHKLQFKDRCINSLKAP